VARQGSSLAREAAPMLDRRALVVAAALGAAGLAAARVLAAVVPVTRSLAALTTRQAVLASQAGEARAAARWRASALYRLLVVDGGMTPAERARALDAGARALARDLGEADKLAAERDRAAAEHDALRSAALAPDVIGPPPALVVPVGGPVLSRFGAARDAETGLAILRPGVRLGAGKGQPVKAAAAATVARVEPEAGGATLVLDLGGGWTVVLGGLEVPAVAAGARVAAGQPLGRAAGDAVTLELWRGRWPVDPLAFARPPAAASPTAFLERPGKGLARPAPVP
jgi:murein DD-endopeptidase MepM/ murein hydrolase activator NlpD